MLECYTDPSHFLVYTHFPDDSIYFHGFKQHLRTDVSECVSPTQVDPRLLWDSLLSMRLLHTSFGYWINHTSPKLNSWLHPHPSKKTPDQLNHHIPARPAIPPSWGHGNPILPVAWARNLELIINVSVSLEACFQSFSRIFQFYVPDIQREPPLNTCTPAALASAAGNAPRPLPHLPSHCCCLWVCCKLSCLPSSPFSLLSTAAECYSSPQMLNASHLAQSKTQNFFWWSRKPGRAWPSARSLTTSPTLSHLPTELQLLAMLSTPKHGLASGTLHWLFPHCSTAQACQAHFCLCPNVTSAVS